MNTIPFSQTHPEPSPETPLNDSIIELIYAGNDLARLTRAFAQELYDRGVYHRADQALALAGRHHAAVEAVHKAVR